MQNDIIVTIRCATYNHAPFIRQCLEGFVMQNTNFRFEAIVHDDASKDGTAAIILEYAEKYPDIIKPIIETENQYSKHDGSLTRIMNEHTHGKYIALCEGDDYWTDPYKLQKQVDFLETHPDYTLCFHNAIEHFEKGEKLDSLFVKNVVHDRDFVGKEILKTWTIPTASVVFRKEVINSELYQQVSKETRFIYGDTVLFLTNAHFGKLHYLNEVMSVYRRHEGGAVFSFNYTNLKRTPAHYQAIIEIFGNEYKEVITSNFLSYIYFRLILESRKRKEYIVTLESALKSFFISPFGFFLGLKEYIGFKFSKIK